MSRAIILIVEDEAIVAMDLEGKLAQLDYQVGAITGRADEAISLARSLKPDLVLMDIQLSGPVDGIEAAEAIRQQCDLPVIFLTAHSDRATLARAKLTGPLGYILKPFDERDLATQIELALSKHQADQAIRRQREWLRVTLSSIGDAVIATDGAGLIAFLNPVAESLTGWKAEAAFGQPVQNVFRLISEETGQPLEEPVARVLREGRPIALANHAALLTQEGHTVPIEDSAAPILDAMGQVIGAVLVFHDVTARRRADETLRASEQKFRSAFANAAIGFAMTAPDGRFVDANPAFCALTGYGIEELRALQFAPLIHPDDHAANMKLIDQMLAGERADFVVENRYRRKNGQVVWVRKSVSLVRDSLGAPQWIIALVEDVSERKRAEEELQGAKEQLRQYAHGLERTVQERTAKLQELVSELEHFSYTITHDMRAPLRAMRCFGEMTTELCADCGKEEPKSFLRRIITASDRMDALIRDALSYSQAVRQEFVLEPVDAAALLRGMLDTYPELQPARAQIQIDGEIPRLLGNEAGLTQCFSNLLGNAVKFVKPGQVPRVRIWAEALESQNNAVDGRSAHPTEALGPCGNSLPHAKDQRVRLWFEDSGIGISKEMQPRIFDMFSRGHAGYEGTGIGLALVRKVMERMGGRVGVESDETTGSKFWLEFRSAESWAKGGSNPRPYQRRAFI